MRAVFIILLLVIGAEGCARKPPESPQPTPATTAPPKSSAPSKPASATPATKGKASPQTAKPSAAKATPAKPAASAPAKSAASAPAKPTASAPKPAASAAKPSLDLMALKEQLKSTKAIGLMTKLTLKNQVDDLLDGFRDHYAGKGKATMPQLRQSYDLLMMKVLSLLQDKDQKLASQVVASREVIWNLLADRQKFAALDV